MMTSQNNTILIENYLNGTLSPADEFLFEAKLMLNKELRRDLYFQKRTHLFIKMYHREKLKEVMEVLHQQIFNDPSKTHFRQRILQIFKS